MPISHHAFALHLSQCKPASIAKHALVTASIGLSCLIGTSALAEKKPSTEAIATANYAVNKYHKEMLTSLTKMVSFNTVANDKIALDKN
ncbi:MAG: hypothetical protein K2P84_00235, partial [Undibacterium sp.]|nr:hypothetical protein [Undibacterium sp.]